MMNSQGSGLALTRQEGYAPVQTEEPQISPPRVTLAALEIGSPEITETPADDSVEIWIYALIMVIMMGYYLPYRMQEEHDQSIRHQFRVQDVTATLNTSTMRFLGDWNVTFRITNRSNMTQLLYQKFAVSVSYEDHLLSVSTFRAGFYQGMHKTTLVNVFPFVTRKFGNYYGSVSSSIRKGWEEKRPLNVTVKLVGRVRESDGDDSYGERSYYNICIACLVSLNYDESRSNNSTMLSGRGEKECDVEICHFPLYT
nr:hypothetical protein A4A49_22578 [Ipomoea batatas]